jgi:hypothetical protein
MPFNEREQLSNQIKSFTDSAQSLNKKRGIVYNVILDENNEYVKGTGIESALIGSIQFRTNSDVTINDESDLPIAYPIDKNFKNLPTKNEVVEIYEFSPKLFGYRRIGVELNPNFNARGTTIKTNFKPKLSETKKASEYSKVQKTGIDRKNEDTSNTAGLGEYFSPQSGIHKLKLYEGDTLIESRFGQSIRFSAYNNDQKSFSPTTIIRNGESPQNRQIDENLSVEEDINQDGSIIAMTSGEYQLNFTPPTNTLPDSFPNIPSKLIGDTILINSGRVILSSKNEEMMFYSKKGFAFASDGDLSFDVNSVEFFTKENFTFSAKDRILTLDSGNAGKINLGSNENDLEPIVKGNTLVELLAELIEILGQAQFATPAGPTAPGPTNVAKLQTLMGKLNTCLSQKNSTV